MIKEFHLFAGIGGGIYGGILLGHICCAGVEINEFCQNILRQRQHDGWMEEFPIYGDLLQLNGKDFKGSFDILCGGFPCQAFSHAAHGKNIAEKNLWPEMFRFVLESEAPIVFGENVTRRAIAKAKTDLEGVGYRVEACKVSCGEIGGDHRRDRFWMLAIKSNEVFERVANHLKSLPRMHFAYWERNIEGNGGQAPITNRREQLKALGNAQAPLAAAVAFRLLVNRHLQGRYHGMDAMPQEIDEVLEKPSTWIRMTYGDELGFIHTPTTMANYSAPSMMKHLGCRNFVKVFGRPSPDNAEYLMGFPLGASSLTPMTLNNFNIWKT